MERRLQLLRNTLAREERDLEKLVKSIRDQRHALLEAQALESELRQKVRSIRGVEAPLAPLQQHGSVLLEKLRPLLPSIKGFLSETSENSVFVSRDQGMVPPTPFNDTPASHEVDDVLASQEGYDSEGCSAETEDVLEEDMDEEPPGQATPTLEHSILRYQLASTAATGKKRGSYKRRKRSSKPIQPPLS